MTKMIFKTFVTMLVGVVLLSGVALSAQAPEGGGAGDAAARIAALENEIEALRRQIVGPPPPPSPGPDEVVKYFSEEAAREMAVLEDRLEAARQRISDLPRRACALTVPWTTLTTRFEAILARLREASAGAAAAPGQPIDLLIRDLTYEAAERRHALTGLDNLDKLITRAEGTSDRVCAKEEKFRALEREEEKHQRHVRGKLLDVAKTTRGNKLLLEAEEFRAVYGNRGRWPKPSGSSWWARSISITKPDRGRQAHRGRQALSINEVFSVVRSITSVNDGRVTVRPGNGSQQASTQWDDGGWFGKTNRIHYWIAKDFRTFSLYMARTRGCSGKSSQWECWRWSGHKSLANRLAYDRQYDLGSSFFPALEGALQKEVTAACERRVADGAALKRLIAARRPARGRARTLYVTAADAFHAQVLRMAQGSAAELCGKRSKLLADVVGTAMELVEPRGELKGIRDANVLYRQDMQNEIDAHVENLLAEQTVTTLAPASGVAVETAEDSAGQAQRVGGAASFLGALVETAAGVVGQALAPEHAAESVRADRATAGGHGQERTSSGRM